MIYGTMMFLMSTLAGIHPHEIDVVELHDCFSPNELITYEALGLCGEGRTTFDYSHRKQAQIVRFMGPTWGPPGSWWPQMGPMLAPWILLSGRFMGSMQGRHRGPIELFTFRGLYQWLRSRPITPVYCSPTLSHGYSLYGVWQQCLRHWGWDKMAAIFQTTFWKAFSWMKTYEFRLRFHCSLFPMVQLTNSQHWFR